MKRQLTVFLTTLFALGFLNAQAQIEEEIKSFVDSTEIIVRQGRKMMAEKINQNNYDKVKEIYNYLNKKTAEEDCSPFGYNEHIYLLTVTNQWDKWLERAANYEEYKMPVCYNIENNIIEFLHNEVVENDSLLTQEIQRSSLKQEEKDLLSLFIYLAGSGSSDDGYGKRLKSFEKAYPQSRYTKFVENYMPDKPNNIVMAWSAGATQTILTSNLANSFEPKTMFNMAFDINVNRLHTSFVLSAGFFALQEPFNARYDDEIFEFKMDEDFDFLDVGVDAGYFIVQNKTFQLAPIIHLGGAILESTRFDAENNENELELINSFKYGAGLFAEVRLFNFTHNTFNYYTQTMMKSNSYIGLKLKGGFNNISKAEYEPYEGNFAYVRLSLVYGIGFY